jgi:hypothetical protein
MNVDAAAKAAAELQQLGPKLPPKAVDQGRSTLLALGANELADGFAANRWPDRKENGRYRYGVVIVETATCKNGKKQAVFHFSAVHEPGKVWPEQLKDSLRGKMPEDWKLSLAESCKGTGESTFEMTSEPLAGAEAEKAWLDAQRRAFKQMTTGFSKVEELEHKALEL